MPRTTASAVASRQLGDEVRTARKAAGLTQAELAKRLGTNPTYVTNVEAGRANPTVGQIANIANALGMSYALHFEAVGRHDVTLPAGVRATGRP